MDMPETLKTPKSIDLVTEQTIIHRDAVMCSLGFPENFDTEMRKLGDLLTGSAVTDAELKKRKPTWWPPERLAERRRVLDIIEDDVLSIPGEHNARGYKTRALNFIREQLQLALSSIMDTLHKVPSLEYSEATEAVQYLLEKYQVSSVNELLDKSSKIRANDLQFLGSGLAEGVAFRNRKINEFAGYVFARKVPTSVRTYDFIRKTHMIVYPDPEKRGEWRNDHAGIQGSASFPDWAILTAMKSFSELVDTIPTIQDSSYLLRQCVRLYVLFELIHPFSNGNGRTGRVMFAFLQRKLSGDQYRVPVHIPIARSEAKNNRQENTRARLGSLSLRVGFLMRQLAQKEKIVSISKQVVDMPPFLLSPTGKQDIPKETVRKLHLELQSSEYDAILDEFIHVCKEQGALDVAQGSEWGRIISEFTQTYDSTVHPR